MSQAASLRDGNHAKAVGPAADHRRQAAYEAALRHSRFVRGLRWGLPILFAATVIGVVSQIAASPFARHATPPQAAEYGLVGSKVTMQAPVLQGFKRDGKPYRLDADTAEQDTQIPNVVQLNTLDAQMGQGDSGWVRMRSAKGIYDNKKETLRLPELVRLLTDGGYDVKLDSADVELKGGVVRSGGPVDVQSPDGTMQSELLEVRDNGKELVFKGRVRTMLHAERPEKPKVAAPQPKDREP
jgi:lipopolysaccharide export system protein LptC